MKEQITSFRKIWEIFRSFRWRFLVMMACYLIMDIGWQIAPLLFGKIINAMQEGKPESAALWLVFGSYACWCFSVGVSWFRQLFQENYIDYDVERHLGNLGLKKFSSLALVQHRSQSSGITQSVVSKGRNSLEQMTFVLLYTVMPLVASTVLAVGALLWFDQTIGLIVLATIAFYIWISVQHNLKYHPHVRHFNSLGDEVSKHFGELLRNNSVTQLNAQEERVQQEHDEKLEKWGQAGQDAWIPYVNWSQPQPFLLFTVRAVILALGVHLFYQGNHQLGDIVVIVAWSNQATGNLWQISSIQRQWLDQWAKIKKYFALLDVTPKVANVPNPVSAKKIKGEIEFRNVSYQYAEHRYIPDERDMPQSEPGPPALRNVSLKVKAGQRVAIVGPSGAGKSTLAFLLTRGDDPTSGEICIDGHNLRQLDLKGYREALGVVEQNVLLFDQTIRYNMLFGLNGRAHEVTDEQIEALARLARIDSFKERLVDGWDTLIGENGVKLSGGERQRVSIARALAKDSKILLLDEATSNLDATNEAYIKDSIRNASQGRTTIIIAHRLSTVIDADQIFVMEQGSIVAQGRHEELCESSSVYRELVSHQLMKS